MSSIETTFSFGTEVTFEGLTIVPLLGMPSSEPDYDTLDAALARGTLHITEVSESGQVPEIKVLNEGQLPVLIIDGEELVGAKQNRTVNVSILVPPIANVVVPVTCVEAGRWSARSRGFSSSSRTHFAAGRAAKSSQVSDSLMRHGTYRADQSQVWQDIEQKSARLQAHSATSAMSEIFERQSTAIEDFVHGLPVVEDQVGAVFFLNGEPMGIDLFDSPRTFRSLIPKIVRGYALDAIDRRSNPRPHDPSNPLPHDSSSTSRPTMKTRAEEFMRQVLDAPRTQFAAPGLGETWRLFAPQVSGGGLIAGGKLLHMSAFLA